MKNLDYIRILQGKTRKEFAHELGLSASHYSRLVSEVDDRSGSVKTLIHACKQLKCEPCLLLCDDLRGLVRKCDFCVLNNSGTTLKDFINQGLDWEQVLFIISVIA